MYEIILPTLRMANMMSRKVYDTMRVRLVPSIPLTCLEIFLSM